MKFSGFNLSVDFNLSGVGEFREENEEESPVPPAADVVDDGPPGPQRSVDTRIPMNAAVRSSGCGSANQINDYLIGSPQ